MRRRLQESFHLSPAAAAATSSGAGFFTAFGSHHHHAHTVPSISVSVQTEPSMINLNGTANNGGLANTAAILNNANGIFQNGGMNSNPNGSGAVVGSIERTGNYATLPHPHHHHHLQNIHVSLMSWNMSSLKETWPTCNFSKSKKIVGLPRPDFDPLLCILTEQVSYS